MIGAAQHPVRMGFDRQHEAYEYTELPEGRLLVWGRNTFTKEKMRLMSTEILVLQYMLSRCR